MLFGVLVKSSRCAVVNALISVSGSCGWGCCIIVILGKTLNSHSISPPRCHPAMEVHSIQEGKREGGWSRNNPGCFKLQKPG